MRSFDLASCQRDALMGRWIDLGLWTTTKEDNIMNRSVSRYLGELVRPFEGRKWWR